MCLCPPSAGRHVIKETSLSVSTEAWPADGSIKNSICLPIAHLQEPSLVQGMKESKRQL